MGAKFVYFIWSKIQLVITRLVGWLVGCLKITIRVIHVIQENLRINMNLRTTTPTNTFAFSYFWDKYIQCIVWVHEQPYSVHKQPYSFHKQPYSVHTVWIRWFIYPFNSRYLFFLIWWYRKFNQKKKIIQCKMLVLVCQWIWVSFFFRMECPKHNFLFSLKKMFYYRICIFQPV